MPVTAREDESLRIQNGCTGSLALVYFRCDLKVRAAAWGASVRTHERAHERTRSRLSVDSVALVQEPLPQDCLGTIHH
jgi:hypothetical protein